MKTFLSHFSLSQTWKKSQKWGMEQFAFGAKNYWFTFAADSSSAIFFLIWQVQVQQNRPIPAFSAFVMGYLLWGLTEYGFHRWIYHQPEGILGEGHRIHHENATELIAMPWFLTTMVVFGLWYLIAIKLHFPIFSGCLAGWLAGFVWYSVVHHSHHHWSFENSWMRKLKAYHRIHHHLHDCNFGVTMRFWDTVFGTRGARSGNKAQPGI